MTELVTIAIEGRLGLITLNRPAAINALNGEMIAALTQTLVAWQDDETVAAVLFEGAGPRGFCAGGDVRAVRAMVLAGDAAGADAYFAAEYRLNGLIAGYGKPTIAITHGAVMGGGIGIAGHARYRLTTPEARFAMPEAAIGFVVDTGVNAILAQTLEARALLFLMAGLPVGAADALALGLADAVIAPDRVAGLRSDLIVAASASHVDRAIVGLMQAESIEAGPTPFCDLADRLAPMLEAEDAGAVVAAVVALAERDATAEQMAEALASHSPTSLEAILMSHRRARQNRSMDEVLAQDLALARLMTSLPDFAEGVRAVLVDKDGAPRWQPQEFAGVDRAAIAAALGGASIT